VVEAALRGGVPAIQQLRNKNGSAHDLYDQAIRLLPLVLAHDALLLINDRLDVALAAGAHGVHVGPTDLPVAVIGAIMAGPDPAAATLQLMASFPSPPDRCRGG